MANSWSEPYSDCSLCLGRDSRPQRRVGGSDGSGCSWVEKLELGIQGGRERGLAERRGLHTKRVLGICRGWPSSTWRNTHQHKLVRKWLQVRETSSRKGWMDRYPGITSVLHRVLWAHGRASMTVPCHLCPLRRHPISWAPQPVLSPSQAPGKCGQAQGFGCCEKEIRSCMDSTVASI